MRIHLDPHDRDFLERLHDLESATVQDLCHALDVTATAVRQRLGRLQQAELVERELVREGRGRPHYRYYVTEKGRLYLGENYADLAQTLWREIRRIETPEVQKRLEERVREALVRRYGVRVDGRTLEEKMDQLRSALAERGFDVELEKRGELPVLRERHCPYLELARTDASICALEQQVFEEVLGTPLTLAQCCRDGDPCCEFQPAGSAVD